jgi:hypothetical protein
MKRETVEHEAHILAMFLLYCFAPRKAEPEPDGSYYIGDVGEARLHDQRLERDNPYAVCRGIRA